jgi:hypothetical protein
VESKSQLATNLGEVKEEGLEPERGPTGGKVPWRMEACVGTFPHLKVPQKRGFLGPFLTLARCPSFNTSLISFSCPP